ncbi:nuclear transport factor 2 family protein [Roseomonas frigidaquae]|uniref:Nuclear transport factor 2 family protein n=1 Tax=Falsiroseomonas frigidaquae TaxID=487318 RepID=A0ABX1F4A2_9PROT|nr:nuclear transport factor 2 family protein [Falsiroseomonas frigidaquae]
MIDVLPAPIEAYVRANARLDAEGMLAPFAPDAVVHDEGGSHAGPEEIRAWIQSATIASRAVFTPDRWHAEGGTIVVEGPTAGAFPGSPIRFTFRFKLAGQAISALEFG